MPTINNLPDLNREIWSRVTHNNLARQAEERFAEMFQVQPTPEGGFEVAANETRANADDDREITMEDIEEAQRRIQNQVGRNQRVIDDLNDYTRSLFYGHIRDVPNGPFPHISIEERAVDRQMVIPPRVSDEVLSVKEHIKTYGEVRVFSAAIRTIKIETPRTRNLYELGVHRLCGVFDLEARMEHDSDIYTMCELFSQLVPRCEIFPAGKFGIDIERHPHCEKCRSWDECCEMKGIYEKQEELCKEAGYRYIVHTVQQNLQRL